MKKKQYQIPETETYLVMIEKDSLVVGSGGDSNLTRDTTYSGYSEDEFWN